MDAVALFNGSFLDLSGDPVPNHRTPSFGHTTPLSEHNSGYDSSFISRPGDPSNL